MQPVSSRIRYIGVDDDNLDLFEGQYPLPRGISYNSYLIDDREIAIIDAVDARRTAEWLASLAALLGERRPSYLIVQHMEPDHSGSIRTVMEMFPSLTVVATRKALDMLPAFFEGIDLSGRTLAVTDGDTLTLGDTVLSFITAPMVHWPEVMFTYDSTDGILFSADAFGSFAMRRAEDAWPAEARRYYANIVGKYGPSVQTVLRKTASLDIRMIAPLHGPALCSDTSRYISLYDRWSRYEPETRGVLVAYASVYGGTAEAARLLVGMIERKGGGETVALDLCRHDVSYAVAEAFRLGSMALCSATYDASIFPPMYTFLHHIALKGLKNRRVGLVENGSWAPVAAKLMASMVEKMRDMTIVEPVVTIRSRLNRDSLAALETLADTLATHLPSSST